MRHVGVEFVGQLLMFVVGGLVGFQIGFVFRPMYDDLFVKLFDRIWPEVSTGKQEVLGRDPEASVNGE